MTETRRLEQALSQAQKLEAIGQLAAGVAHDFNNLLIPILGYSEMAIDAVGQGQVADDLRAVIQAGQQAKELTTQLLAFARKQALDMRPLALSAEVSGFASVLRRMLRENVTLQLELDDDVQLIRADQTQIRQVLMNLVSNAQDAMPSGGKLSIGVRTLVVGSRAPDNAALTPGAYLELSVSDSGTGMDAATQARIFEPFFTTKPAERGTGLGLAMVYGCVHQHGGQLQLRSAPGRGTTFRLFFPVIDGAAPSPALPSLVPPARQASDTVLLVEDQDTVRELVARVLRDEGYEVVEAADGKEALLRASEHQRPIGLLVSDVIMPHMGGYELLERLRRSHRDMRALFLSGYSEEAATRPRELDAHFLPKPFAVAALKRVVRQVLATEPRP
jgi:CheY-like chemotaxis protein